MTITNQTGCEKLVWWYQRTHHYANTRIGNPPAPSTNGNVYVYLCI